jgi:hypothetical protein
MKIKTRPDDADMPETSELFQMNGWLAELRDEGRAESWDDDGSGVEDNGYFKRPGDGRAESANGSRTASWQDSRTGSREDGRARPGDDSQAGSRDDGRAGIWGEAYRRPQDDGHARSGENGQAGPRNDRQVKPPRGSYPRPEASAAGPVTTPVTRTRTTGRQATGRAVIGDQLRLPIMWCEMGSCISWFAHPAALGEADIRARAIDAGWRVDAVGLLVCPQCEQTAPGFQSPLPVVLWDREEAIAMSAQMADEPSVEAVASVAKELSHDLRCPPSDHRDEAVAASTWIAAVPADDVARSVGEATSDEVRRPAGDHQPENHLRPGRHRKRLVARLTFASH